MTFFHKYQEVIDVIWCLFTQNGQSSGDSSGPGSQSEATGQNGKETEKAVMERGAWSMMRQKEMAPKEDRK